MSAQAPTETLVSINTRTRRAHLSAGLLGADWWVAGPAAATADDADVELDEVERLYTEHDQWDNLL